MKEKLKPIIKTEEQFLFVCHLVGPFFQRFHIERTRCMLDVRPVITSDSNYLSGRLLFSKQKKQKVLDLMKKYRHNDGIFLFNCRDDAE
jgi:hypothetical protein